MLVELVVGELPLSVSRAEEKADRLPRGGGELREKNLRRAAKRLADEVGADAAKA